MDLRLQTPTPAYRFTLQLIFIACCLPTGPFHCACMQAPCTHDLSLWADSGKAKLEQKKKWETQKISAASATSLVTAVGILT